MKYIIKFCLVILYTVPAAAQISSAYTRVGIGDLQYSYSAKRTAMGELGISMFDQSHITTLNPAAWGRIDLTRIEVGMSVNGLFISDANQKSYLSEASLSGFTFGFPLSIKNGVSFALGLVPYSNVSYRVNESYSAEAASNELYETSYRGSGGLNKLFLGSSFKLPFDLSFGAVFEYYFGKINYYSLVNFIRSDFDDTEYNTNFSSKGLGTTVGVISPDLSNLLSAEKISDFRIGVSFNHIGKLTTDSVLTSLSSIGLKTISSANVRTEIPARTIAGISLIYDKNFNFTFDYLFQPWSNFTLGGKHSPYMRDLNKASLGVEYKPSREIGSSFMEQIIWRAGLSYEMTQYKIQGQGIDQYSISTGFSFPLSYVNSLDIALQYALRGSTDFSLMKEQIIKLSIGLSFGELWFTRPDF